jgi:hypothetical protein
MTTSTSSSPRIKTPLMATPRKRARVARSLTAVDDVVDTDDGIVVNYTVEIGNPADAPKLARAIARIAGASEAVRFPAARGRGRGRVLG